MSGACASATRKYNSSLSESMTSIVDADDGSTH
jgi:hypothetical protein